MKLPVVFASIKATETVQTPPPPKTDRQQTEKPSPKQSHEAKTTVPQPTAPTYVSQYRNHGELLMAIDNYVKRGQQLNQEIKKEHLEVQRIQIVRDSIDGQNRLVKDEILKLKASIGSMSRGKEGVPTRDSAVQAAPEPKPAAEKAAPPRSRAPDSTSAAVTASPSVDTSAASGNPAKTDSDTASKVKAEPIRDTMPKPAAVPKGKQTF
jgi:hypothetical protein